MAVQPGQIRQVGIRSVDEEEKRQLEFQIKTLNEKLQELNQSLAKKY